jgi:hypothetical protein
VISHELRCIFIHIQKTGGSSIRQALGLPQQGPEKHRFATEQRALCDPAVWNAYFKFAFVRNPWDRLVSWWVMIDRNIRAGHVPNGFQAYVASRAHSFEEFLRNCNEEYHDADGIKSIYRNQVDYVCDDSGKLLVDFVGRFERLEEDFATVAARLGVATAIPHLNRSTRSPYAGYYTSALASLVAERYAKDIAAFGYEFGGR